MIEYIETFTFSGGKRVRPYLTYLAYKTCGGHQDDQIMSFSKSLELLHTMALVHDDIIDQGEKRHGVACYHKFIATHVKGKNADHIGESQALLVGDLMLSRVYEVLNDMYQFSSQSLVNAKQNMQETIEEVILGQMIDVDMMVGDEIDLEKLEAKNHYKSWSYTFSRPLMTGALLAGVSDAQVKLFQKLWQYLGSAYQMRDDLLDITVTNNDATGHYDDKTKFSDIQDGQQTFLTHYIMQHGSRNHRLTLSQAMGKRLWNSEIDALRELFETSGAIAYGKQQIEEYLSQADKIIKKLNITSPEIQSYYSQIIELLRTY